MALRQFDKWQHQELYRIKTMEKESSFSSNVSNSIKTTVTKIRFQEFFG